MYTMCMYAVIWILGETTVGLTATRCSQIQDPSGEANVYTPVYLLDVLIDVKKGLTNHLKELL